MKRLMLAVVGLLLVGCGGSAADTLRGGTWKIEKWTYSIDSVFDGSGNMAPSKTTSTASADNAGTLAFTGGEEVGIGGGGQLARTFTQLAQRGTNEAKFGAANASDTLSWDPRGFNSEDDQVTSYDGNDESWNGAWTLTGSGDEVTLTRSFQIDFSATQHQVEHHTLKLKR
jgi:hypothetical protein